MPGNDFAYYFNSILTQGKKDNTYKFALARFLIDYSYSQDQSVIETKIRNYETQTIEYSIIAKAFLRFYWHQICAYKIKQNPNPSKLPIIVQIVHRIFGKKYIPESFEKMDKNKIQQAEVQVTEECFREVIPRFQNIPSGIGVVEQKVFYDYYENVKKIALKPNAMKYFKENHTLLLKATMLVKFGICLFQPDYEIFV